MADNNTRKVKNKAVAQLQISAEQILLEAYERKEEPLKVPLQKFTDLEEVRFRLLKMQMVCKAIAD